MAQPKVSVVVPVYNTERYLAKCLDSLVSQTLDDIEILVVNDGSPDTSQALIDAYAAAHAEKIVPLTKPNGGLSDARNFGVRHAKGEFVGFVDSDDYVETEMFESLYSAAASAGTLLAMGQYLHHGLNGVTSVQGVMSPATSEIFEGTDFLLQQTSMVVWNKLYHYTLARQFPFPHTWFEDVAWTPLIMTHCERFSYVRRPLYHYIRREGSIASNHHDPRTLQGIESLHSAIANCAPNQRDVVVYMAARRLLFESRVRKCYADKYIAALAELAPVLKQNRYFQENDALRVRCYRYFNNPDVIPKRIFYSSFGSSRPTRLQEACINSWSNDLVYGDGDVIRLDESNCDLTREPLIAQLYEAGEYKTVGDYFKVVTVLESGGVAMSQNVMATDFIAPLLINGAFFSQTPENRIFDGAFGAVANHQALCAIRDRFLQLLAQGYDASTVLERAIERYLDDEYGTVLDGHSHRVSGTVTLFGKGIFHSKYGQESVATYIPEPSRGEQVDAYRMYSVAYVDGLVRERVSVKRDNNRLRSRAQAAERRLARTRSSNRWRLVWRLRWLDSSRLLTGLALLTQERKLRRKSVELDVRAKYARLVDRTPVDQHLVLLESFYGRGLLSNPLALFQAWSRRPDFSRYRFIWVLDNLESHTDVMVDARARYPNVTFVERGRLDYYETLAQAKYLINDVSFFFDFVKKPGQVYINPWHSVSVKTLGYDIPEWPLSQKNVVRNFLACSYFVAANDFVRDRVFWQAHLMKGLFPGAVLEEGHPRNDLTVRADRAEIIRELQAKGLLIDQEKDTLVFAPTWRGENVHRPSDDLDSYAATLAALESAVGKRYNVLIRLHQAAHANLPLGDSMLKVAIPPTIDANRMFAAVDLLITDYSSIFFDYLITGRPILFYIPDLDQYRNSRGVYFDVDQLPGPATSELRELVASVERIDYLDDEFRHKRDAVARWAIKGDDGSVSERVLARVLDGSPNLPEAGPIQGRKRVLFHAGTLRHQPAVDKLRSLLTTFDPADYDISVLVTDSSNKRTRAQVSELLSQGIRVLGRSDHVVLTRLERYLLTLLESTSTRVGLRLLSRAVRREWRRCLGDATFDLTVNLDSESLLVDLALAESGAGVTVAWLKAETRDVVPYECGLERTVADRYDHVVSTNAEFESLRTRWDSDSSPVG